MKPVTYIILLLVLFSGCEKYPEGGPVNGLSGTDERISGGYSIDAFMVNDVDSTAALRDKFSSCGSEALHFTLINSAAKHLESSCMTLPSNSWEADSRTLSIRFSFTPGAADLFPIVCNREATIVWDIERLNRKWLWIKTTVNGNRYYLRLKQA